MENSNTKKINLLIESIQQTPFEGIGKPQLLKHEWAGMWSRRINSEHRLIYELKSNQLHIYSLKDHY